MKYKNWKPFFFESNQFFGKINNPEDWALLKAAYPFLCEDQLLDAKESTYKGHRRKEVRDVQPNYGFRIEHDGERTLRDFFKENGMCLPNKLQLPETTPMRACARGLVRFILRLTFMIACMVVILLLAKSPDDLEWWRVFGIGFILSFPITTIFSAKSK